MGKGPKRSRRRIAFRDQRRVVRVLTEGEVTEPAYLRVMASETVRLDIGRTGGFVPMSLVRRARKEAKANRRARGEGFDEIWCVFDRDEHPNLEQAMREARDSGVCTALSNPCFEVWLLLHVEPCSAHIERRAAAGPMRRTWPRQRQGARGRLGGHVQGQLRRGQATSTGTRQNA